MTISMAELKLRLPKNCQIRDRGKYLDVYYIADMRYAPEGWKNPPRLGRTDKDSIDDIIKKAEEEHARYEYFKRGIEAKPRPGSIPDVIEKYKKSQKYLNTSPRTKKNYECYLELIRDWSARAAHPHISKMQIKSIISWLNLFRETPDKQRYAKTVLSLLFRCAYNHGYVENKELVAKIELDQEKTESRALVMWSQEDVDRVVAEADKLGLHSIGGILLTAMETAQRRSDVVKMVRGKDYVDGELQYYQSKTKKYVWFPVTDKLKERLEKFHSGHLALFVCETTGKQWHPDSVTHKIREICDSLGMNSHIIMQMRHSQINYLYEIGCTDQEIIAMTGHERPETMRHFYREKVNKELASKAVARINEHRKAPT